jgi:hypothetical protein
LLKLLVGDTECSEGEGDVSPRHKRLWLGCAYVNGESREVAQKVLHLRYGGVLVLVESGLLSLLGWAEAAVGTWTPSVKVELVHGSVADVAVPEFDDRSAH